jgi:hypothetical protein
VRNRQHGKKNWMKERKKFTIAVSLTVNRVARSHGFRPRVPAQLHHHVRGEYPLIGRYQKDFGQDPDFKRTKGKQNPAAFRCRGSASDNWCSDQRRLGCLQFQATWRQSEVTGRTPSVQKP